MAKIKLKQIGSPIRRPESQKKILIGLGLGKRCTASSSWKTPPKCAVPSPSCRTWWPWSTDPALIRSGWVMQLKRGLGRSAKASLFAEGRAGHRSMP